MRVGGTLGIEKWKEAEQLVTLACMGAFQVQYPMKGFSWKKEPACIPGWKALGVPLYVHAPFFINPCEPDLLKSRRYRGMIYPCLEFAKAIDAVGVVLHPGVRKEDQTEDQAKEYLLSWMRELMRKSPVKIFLETDSGSKEGRKVGSFELLCEVCERLYNPQVRICMDTAHLYARGINMWHSDIRDKVLDYMGGHLELVHLNMPDPEVRLGSYLDRHSICLAAGDGIRGSDSGKLIRALSQFPMILERNDTRVQIADMQTVQVATLDIPEVR